LVTLISAQAALEASSSAMMKQAEGATEQCKKLLDENEQLRKGGAKAKTATENQEEENAQNLQSKLDEKNKELKEKEKEVERMKKDLEGMKAQAEGLHKEYDRILDENQKLEKKLRIQGVADEESKKDN